MNGLPFSSEVIVLLIPLLLTILYVRWSRSRKSFPSIGMFNMMYKFNHASTKKLHLFIADLAEQLNGTFKLGRYVLIGDKDTALELCVRQDPLFNGRLEGGDPLTFAIFFNGEDIVFKTYNRKLKLLRKLVFKALHIHGCGLEEFELIVREELLELCGRLSELKEQDVDPSSHIYSAVANITATLLFGEKFGIGSEEVEILSELDQQISDTLSLDGEASELILNPYALWLLKLPIPRYRRKRAQLDKLFAIRDAAFSRIVNRHKESFDPAHLRGVLGYVQLAQHEYGKDVINEQNIMGVMLDLILAGTMTTFSAIKGLLLSLASDLPLQRRIRQEIHETFGTEGAPRWAHRTLTPLTSAAILEQLRFQSILPLGIVRMAMGDTQLGGYDIRRGDAFMVNYWTIHHDPRYWEQPNKFYPQHFLDQNGQLLTTDVYKQKGFLPFGAGRRNCLGETLAKSRLYVIITSILQQFEVLPPQESSLPPNTAESFEFNGLIRPSPYTIRFRHNDTSI